MPTAVAAPATKQAIGPGASGWEPAARPVGPWDTASLDDVLAAVPTLSWWNAKRQQAQRSVAGVELLLDWLGRVPGGWQDRWEHAEAMLGPRWATWSAAIPEPDRPCGERHRVVLTRGLACLLRMRLVRPSYPFLTTYGPTTTFAVVRDLVSPELFACAADAARACGGHSENVLRKALNVLTAIVIHTGGSLNEVTTGDLLAFQSATAPSR
ncbi:hypothetical protein E0F15_23375, partial [Frankia sp. B2]